MCQRLWLAFFLKKLEFLSLNAESAIEVLLRKQTPATFVDTSRSLVEGVRIMQREYGFVGDVEESARERIAIVREIFEQEVEFIDGFLAFFAYVRNVYKTCIATAMAEDLLMKNGTKAILIGWQGQVQSVVRATRSDLGKSLVPQTELGTIKRLCQSRRSHTNNYLRRWLWQKNGKAR